MRQRLSQGIAILTALAVVVLGACQSDTRNRPSPSAAPPQRDFPAANAPAGPLADTSRGESADRVLQRLADFPAGQTPDALARVGFRRLTGDDLLQSVRGRVLRVVASDSQFKSDGSMTLRDSTLGRTLSIRGTWAVREDAVCQSSGDEHDFCTAIFARGNDTLCWPDSAGDPNQVAVLRDCTLLSNGRPADVVMRTPPPPPARTATAPPAPVRPAPSATPTPSRPTATTPQPPVVVSIDDVVARLDALAPDDARRQLAAFGFRSADAAGLSSSLTGNTLSESRSLTYFAGGGVVSIRDNFLGRNLRSQGRWTVRQGAACHSVREGHEFCTGIFVRGNETLCWPGMDTADTAAVRRCTIMRGDRVG